MASPELLKENPLGRPEDLANHTLLHDGSPDTDDSCPDWPMWLAARGLRGVDGTRGRLSANTVSGEIAVRDHAGDLRLNSVSGDLAASGELTLVQANTVSGALTLDVTSGTSSLTASTVSGD